MSTMLTIDAGTTGVTALLIADGGNTFGRGYSEFPQHSPRPGWVEHHGMEIMSALRLACHDALTDGGTSASDLTTIGSTNQRETTLVWDRATGHPIHDAIDWQDRRTADVCTRLRDAGHDASIRATTGLVVDAYFSGTKIAWPLDNVDGARGKAVAGELAFGTIDTWIVSQLTGGRSSVTEPSNACRTMLYDIDQQRWSPYMADLLDVPMGILPEVMPSVSEFGTTDPDAFLGAAVPIRGILGDQQAALFGQGCWSPGMLAASVPDTGDVFLVPAFAGLGAPHWDPYARGTIVGLTRGTTWAHIARATIEAMAFQTCDVIEAMETDSGLSLDELRVDGGASAMDLLCEFQADLLGVDVLRPKVRETTALGAGFAAGLGAGVWSSVEELADVWALDARFTSAMEDGERAQRRSRWRQGLSLSRGWAAPDGGGA